MSGASPAKRGSRATLKSNTSKKVRKKSNKILSRGSTGELQKKKETAQIPVQADTETEGSKPTEVIESIVVEIAPSIMVEGVHEGLGPLVAAEAVVILQELKPLGVTLAVETCRRYKVLNNLGISIFFAGETSKYCNRLCLGPNRPFVISLFDETGRVVVTMTRMYNKRLAFWGSRNSGSIVTVRSGITDELYGTIKENWSFVTPGFVVRDENEKDIMIIRGPRCGNFCCGNYKVVVANDVDFPVYLLSSVAQNMNVKPLVKSEVEVQGQVLNQVKGKNVKSGKIRKQKELRGYTIVGDIVKRFVLQQTEVGPDVNVFGIYLSQQLDPRLKAVLIGATFCVDLSYFESGFGISIFDILLVLFTAAVIIGVYLLLHFAHDANVDH